MSGFDEAHALIVRPVGGLFQIISGHNRRVAAERAGLVTLPCWVREMDDATAYMELVRANAQGELTALERGMHALHSGMEVKEYAESVGRARTTIQDEVKAARVASAVTDIRHDMSSNYQSLVAIHAAPRWLWRALVTAGMSSEAWTVEAARKSAQAVKNVAGVKKCLNAEVLLGSPP